MRKSVLVVSTLVALVLAAGVTYNLYLSRYRYSRHARIVFSEPIEYIAVQGRYAGPFIKVEDPQDIQRIAKCLTEAEPVHYGVSTFAPTCLMKIVLKSGAVEEIHISPTFLHASSTGDPSDVIINWGGEDRVGVNQPFSVILRRLAIRQPSTMGSPLSETPDGSEFLQHLLSVGARF
jgi:hypothetical protein